MKDINKYIKESWESAREYIKGVEDESIITNKWIKKSVKRHLKDIHRDDLDYRTEEVEKVFKFFYFLNINKDNSYKRFNLLPFQAFIVVALFGLYHKDTDKRKYRYAFLFMARKSGKSVFAAGLQLYFLMADGVEDPQSLLLASTREQASICLEYATGIVHHSPSLEQRLEPQRYKIVFKDKTKGGFSKVLASNASKLDGYSASAAILDEIHAYKDDSLFNVIKSSILARKNPMLLLITTAGFSLTSFCFNYMKYAQNVMNDDVSDDSLFTMMFTLDEGDDITDTKNWYKSNPALGHISELENLEIEFAQSQYSITQMNNFKTKHLNVFIEQANSWIKTEVLNESFVTEFDIKELYGSEIYLGLDLSATRDLTALVGVVPKDDKFYVIPYFFMANNAEKFLRGGGVNLKEWIRDGHIQLCETPTIDYDLVVETFKEIKKNFDIRLCAYDPHNSAAIINKLWDLEIPTKAFQQRALNFNEGIKFLEKAIYDKNIYMKNPALKWNINNCVPYIDGNANIKFLKNKSLDSIDGAVSLAMAMGIWLDINKTVEITEDVWN